MDQVIPTQKTRRTVPIACIVLYVLAFCAAVLHILFYFVPAFADAFNMTVGAFCRAVAAYLTALFPFSLAETVIICLPFAVVLLAVICVRATRYGTGQQNARIICILLAVLCALYSSFVFLFASAYRGAPLAQKLALDADAVSAEQLAVAAEYFRSRAQEQCDEIDYVFGGESTMPYSFSEMVDKLNDAYAGVSERYDFVQRLRAPVKQIALSHLMTYTHISGVYTYYTGEANLNINFPDYTLPYTAAHEMSHQRGIAAENEANFMAFLVCDASEDAYIRYSGYMNMYEYLMNALYSADPERYYEIWAKSDSRMQYEQLAYNRFFNRYSESAAATVSSAINNTYLKSQGQSAGERSYGMVVDLAVAYVENQSEK